MYHCRILDIAGFNLVSGTSTGCVLRRVSQQVALMTCYIEGFFDQSSATPHSLYATVWHICVCNLIVHLTEPLRCSIAVRRCCRDVATGPNTGHSIVGTGFQLGLDA